MHRTDKIQLFQQIIGGQYLAIRDAEYAVMEAIVQLEQSRPDLPFVMGRLKRANRILLDRLVRKELINGSQFQSTTGEEK